MFALLLFASLCGAPHINHSDHTNARRAAAHLAPRLTYLEKKLRAAKFSEIKILNTLNDPRIRTYHPHQGPRKTINWARVRAHILSSQTIHRGLRLLKQYTEVLSAAERRYGVPKEVLMGVAATESDLGWNEGRHVVLSVFYYGLLHSRARGKWKAAANNLVAMLVYCRKNRVVDCLSIHGSWAGAYGFTQFMPRTALAYAVDGEGNGRIDLLDARDALPSTANYLEHLGWRRSPRRALSRYYGSPVGYPSVVLAYARALRKRISP